MQFAAMRVTVALCLVGALQPAFAADPPAPWTTPVPPAKCGPGSRAESGLQGSTSLAERFGGASAQGFHCNMELVGQVQG